MPKILNVFLNPFHGIIETYRRPGARTLRIKFWEKMEDTFNVFTGVFFDSKVQKRHLGLFDYLTLTASYRILQLFLRCLQKFKKEDLTIFQKILLALPIGLLGLILIPLMGVRYALGAIFCVIVSPIVAIVHGISKIEGDWLKGKLRDQIISIKYENSSNRIAGFSSRIRFGSYIEEAESISISTASGTYNELKLTFTKLCESENNKDGPVQAIATLTLNLENSDDRAVLNSIERLNLGNIVEKIEKLGIFTRYDNETGNSNLSLGNKT